MNPVVDELQAQILFLSTRCAEHAQMINALREENRKMLEVLKAKEQENAGA